MRDIKITSIRVFLPITPPVYRISDSPPSIRILGSRFSEARYVYLNDIEVIVFAIISDGELIAQIPDLIGNNPITKVVVAGESFTAQETNLLHFDLGNTFRSLSGLQRLVQHFVKVLLQAPGSNKFNPLQGGGLLKMIGQNTINEGKSVVADVIDSVTRTKNDIISDQNKDKNIPMDERLLNVTIDNVYIADDKVSLILTLTLTNSIGSSLNTNLSL